MDHDGEPSGCREARRKIRQEHAVDADSGAEGNIFACFPSGLDGHFGSRMWQVELFLEPVTPQHRPGILEIVPCNAGLSPLSGLVAGGRKLKP